MADTDTATVDGQPEADAAPANGGLIKKLMIGGGAVALLAAGLFAGPVVQNMLAPAADEPLAEEAAEAVARPANAGGPELYTGLHPAMVVNFRDAVGDQHFMQIEMEVMARDQDVIDAVKDHTPLIRNNLILLYGGVSYEHITTRAGKEQMLADGLKEIQDVLTARIGKPNVEALYFTSLIIQ